MDEYVSTEIKWDANFISDHLPVSMEELVDAVNSILEHGGVPPNKIVFKRPRPTNPPGIAFLTVGYCRLEVDYDPGIDARAILDYKEPEEDN